MKQRIRIIGIILMLSVLGGGYVLYNMNLLPFFPGIAEAQSNTVSGTIQGHEVNIVAEIGGRVAAIDVDEGDHVTAGQELIHIDHTLLDTQIAQAQASVNTSQAQLAQLMHGPQAADIAAARAALQAAQQNYDKLRGGPAAPDRTAAQSALAAARQNYDKVRRGPTADQLGQLKAQLDNAKAALDQAQSAYDRIGGATNPYIQLTPQSAQLQQTTNNYTAALAMYNEAKSHPTPAELAAAQSQVQQAQAALDRLTPTKDSITIADNQVKQAEAALAVLQAQVAKMSLTSPVAGVVTNRAVQPGELATPGSVLLTVTRLDPVTLTIYVPESDLGHIRLGQQVDVQVDSFPGRNFVGKITFINSNAEFTPRNVQTKEQRVNTVFAVKVELPNPNQELKPGMPADALVQ